MIKDNRIAELTNIFKDVDETERLLVDNLISEVVYYEEEMEKLKLLQKTTCLDGLLIMYFRYLKINAYYH